MPFEQVVEAVQPARDLSRTPLFQVVFAWQNAALPTAEVGELRLRPVAAESGTAKFDLTLDLSESGEEITGALEYNTDLFERETIARLAGHLQTLLAGAVAGPERPLHELPLLGEGERRQVLLEWNQTAAAYPQGVCVHELFEAQVVRSSEAVAVVFEEQQWTYAELNARANSAGATIYAAPWGWGRRCGWGSAWSEVAGDGGGAFGHSQGCGRGPTCRSLDPEYPPGAAGVPAARRAGAGAADAGAHLRGRLPEHQAQVVLLDGEEQAWQQGAEHNPQGGVGPENLAYVIYTSGSTGNPKGVMVKHASLLNLIAWHQRNYAVQALERASQVASLAFDACVWELWPYLTAGACVCLAPSPLLADPSALLKWLAERGIALSFAPTPLATVLLHSPWPDGLVLRALLTGGEQLLHGPGDRCPVG